MRNLDSAKTEEYANVFLAYLDNRRHICSLLPSFVFQRISQSTVSHSMTVGVLITKNIRFYLRQNRDEP